jgi:hypothetical protein
MSKPIVVDLPHSLGKQEAKRRLQNNIGKLRDHIPGGADVGASWTDDRMDLSVGAMGQQVAAKIDVQDNIVRLEVMLPAALSFFGGMIEGLIRRQGAVLLEDKSGRKKD